MAHRILNISDTVNHPLIPSTIYGLLYILYCLLCELKCLLLYFSIPVADLADIIVLVCSVRFLVTSLMGGVMTMARLTSGAMVK